MDLFVVPTIGFKLLYGFVIVRIDRRDLVWINVTANPAAEWIARQLTEAFPWDGAPGHMIRDRDRIYGAVVTRRLRAMGIRDKPIAAASPWQNGFAERLIGSIRRECLDHIIVSGEAHLRRSLISYAYPTIRQVSEFRRTIGGNIADLGRVGKSGSALSLPNFYDFARLPSIVYDLLRSMVGLVSASG
jgi:transposase InsO family protein